MIAAGGLDVRQPRQRHGAKPRAGRARQPGCARGDARRDLRAARRARRGGLSAARPAPRDGSSRPRPVEGSEQRLVVDVPGRGPRPAIADVALSAHASPGDDVLVNTQAADLELGSGGFDVVHVEPDARPRRDGRRRRARDEAQLQLAAARRAARRGRRHGDRRPLAAPPRPSSRCTASSRRSAGRYAQAGGGRLGFVQTAGGALPGRALARRARAARARPARRLPDRRRRRTAVRARR